MDLFKEDLAGYDAIIDGVSAWVPETFHVHFIGRRALIRVIHIT